MKFMMEMYIMQLVHLKSIDTKNKFQIYKMGVANI